MPDVPVIGETVPGYAAEAFQGVVAPAGVARPIVDKLAASVNKFLADPAVRAKLNDQYLAPIPGTPAGIQQRGEAEAGVWGGLIRDLKIQAD